ncbi:MAG: DUF1572 family protein [Chitinophagaceae bacterium]|nr:DUF1572 family protein [Chitinophagaceae bacterium]MBK9465800.1 DUF1572 family protein [Chitinophagaceae bacterium]MBP6234083.1 DUF1572 family protein [Chitinophagaceae bacterium]
MNTPSQIAKQFRDVLFGGNWTSVNMKETLADISWQQANTKFYSFNTIAILVYHMNYYVGVISKVLQGQPLDGKDKDSFVCPPIESAEDWEKLVQKTWNEAETFANLIEQLPDSKLEEIFINEKYGNYYRNLHGVIEHYHYHLGQIVLIKKIINSSPAG